MVHATNDTETLTYLPPADLGGQKRVAHDTDPQVERLYLRLQKTGGGWGGD